MHRFFTKFDEVTRFRLINSFLFALSFNIIVPVLADLKGELLLAYVISIFMILTTLSVKTNRFFVEHMNLDKLYKIGIVVHVLYLLTALVYFKNELWFVYIDMTLAIIDIAIFSAYSISLDGYLADNYPHNVKEFGITRNNVFANGTLIGLSISTVCTYFDNDYAVIASLIMGIGFSSWLIKNWNFYKEIK